ncbi:MAG: glycoside hydrolase family 97 protein [Bacteroidales bacterium]|nr:glycoside hydrolase family 97 protein [Bacteroidales bacterium]
MRKIIFFLSAVVLTMPLFSQEEFELSSPNKEIKILVQLKNKVNYTVFYKDLMVIDHSPISLNINDGNILGLNPVMVRQNTRSVSESLYPVHGKRKEIKDEYNELIMDFNRDYSIIFRAYNEGVAYRFVTRIKGPIVVTDEEVSFRFTDNYPVLMAPSGTFQSSYEYIYKWTNILDINETNFTYCPAIVKLKNNVKIAITESDTRNYPGLYLIRMGRYTLLKGIFPQYPVKTEQSGSGMFNIRVIERAGYIAKTNGTRSFPWRVMVITDKDEILANNDMVYKLASPSEVSETDWIRPGNVAWEWWHGWNLEGVDFESGRNTKTYEYYIDFAAENGIDYVLFDEGWSDQFDLTLVNPDLDMEHLFRYAKEKNVRLILWCVWHTLEKQMDVALDLFEKWGAAGIKVDFIDRDDQAAIEFYENTAREAAKRHLLVDFHGCSKPTGLHRTFPNVVNYEGVVGNEYNKGNWRGQFPDPEHNVTIPFTRMLAGPMDYTPGAMRNGTQSDFAHSDTWPMSWGTRCHQLGMYVVYDAPLQMLCDAPTEYRKYPDILAFISRVPVTWDETLVPDAELGEYIITVRKKDEDWYVGALTDWSEREVTIRFDFLGNEEYHAEIFTDGINANSLAIDYKRELMHVKKDTVLKIKLAKGGGAAMRITPIR